jgi:LacI family transcriptional regulator
MPAVLTNGTVQGAIILNLYDERMAREINQLNIPKVFLDTVPQMDTRELKGDLILLEGHNTTYDITRSVIEKGLEKIGFIGDVHYAQTNQDRFEGFCQCMILTRNNCT